MVRLRNASCLAFLLAAGCTFDLELDPPPRDGSVSDAAPETCSADEQCPAQLPNCQNGVCNPACDGDEDCSSDYCDTSLGRCLENVPFGGGCVRDSDCEDRLCRVPIAESCAFPGEDAPICTAVCTTDNDCPEDFACLFWRGSGLCAPLAMGRCDGARFAGTTRCHTDNDCRIANSEYCAMVLPDSFNEWDQSPACWQNAIASPPGALCDPGPEICRSATCNSDAPPRCGKLCCNALDCTSGTEACALQANQDGFARVCTPVTTSSATCALGEVCPDPCPCPYDGCIRSENADGSLSEEQICTVMCCRNADCASIPGTTCRTAEVTGFNGAVGVCQRSDWL